MVVVGGEVIVGTINIPGQPKPHNSMTGLSRSQPEKIFPSNSSSIANILTEQSDCHQYKGTQMLTEQEAAKKFCHLTMSGGGKASECIGSRCMAWQWTQKTFWRRTDLWSKKSNKVVNSAWGDDAEWRPVDGTQTNPPEPQGKCSLIPQHGFIA